MAEWVTAGLTIVIAFFTFLVFRVYQRMAFLTGAIESHSNLMVRIEAKRGIDGKSIKAIWWDPTVEKTPIRQHGQEDDLSTIYLFLPQEQRKYRPTAWQRLKTLLAGR
jgi:hypothetical protein